MLIAYKIGNSILFFKILIDSVIPGLAIGLRTMRKGELAQFLVNYQYGFGELGSPPRVPPKAECKYDLRVTDIYRIFISTGDKQKNCLLLLT